MILDKLFSRHASRAISENPLTWFGDDWSGGVSSYAGKSVTVDNALTVGAVYASVRVISEAIASLPLIVYRRLENGGKDRVKSKIAELLRFRPNPWMSSFQFFETAMAHVLLWGNSYSHIRKNMSGVPVAIIPLHPSDVTPKFDENRELFYNVFQRETGVRSFLAKDILHVAGLAFDGISGKSVIRTARQSIGSAMATEEFAGKYWSGGAKPYGFLSHPGQLGAEGRKKLKESWQADEKKIAVLEGGIKSEQIGIPPEDSQFLQTREFQATDVARVFRVPGHMIGIHDSQPRANVEQEAIDFVTHTLGAWIRRIEQEVTFKFFDNSELFAEFLVDSHLRGDTETRFKAYSMALQNGWLSRNEVRTLENRNPIEGGDSYTVQLNLTDISQIGAGDGNNSSARSEPIQSKLTPDEWVESLKPLFRDALERLAGKESRTLKAGLAKCERDGLSFSEWSRNFWDDHKRCVFLALFPILEAGKRLFKLGDVESLADLLAERYISDGIGDSERDDDEAILDRCELFSSMTLDWLRGNCDEA